ncbi:MAG: hypothetical protein HY420_01745 [Candidatus Kerfeldbacteria bacterium]|nr:hypothetical protein [Candidatus Kerfeldbacteria bacterium]
MVIPQNSLAGEFRRAVARVQVLVPMVHAEYASALDGGFAIDLEELGKALNRVHGRINQPPTGTPTTV